MAEIKGFMSLMSFYLGFFVKMIDKDFYLRNLEKRSQIKDV